MRPWPFVLGTLLCPDYYRVLVNEDDPGRLALRLKTAYTWSTTMAQSQPTSRWQRISSGGCLLLVVIVFLYTLLLVLSDPRPQGPLRAWPGVGPIIADVPTATPRPTAPPVPTATRVPTATPSPTATLVPTVPR